MCWKTAFRGDSFRTNSSIDFCRCGLNNGMEEFRFSRRNRSSSDRAKVLLVLRLCTIVVEVDVVAMVAMVAVVAVPPLLILRLVVGDSSTPSKILATSLAVFFDMLLLLLLLCVCFCGANNRLEVIGLGDAKRELSSPRVDIERKA